MKLHIESANILAVLYRLSIKDDESDQEEDADDDENPLMPLKTRLRFLTVCKARARTGSSGARTRCVLQRKCERKEAAHFRALRADLLAYTDPTDEELSSRQKYLLLDRGRLSSTAAFRDESWRWEPTLRFLRRYFPQHFADFFSVRPNSQEVLTSAHFVFW